MTTTVADRPLAETSQPVRKHWSRFTWLIALGLTAVGAGLAYGAARTASAIANAVGPLVLYGLLTVLVLAFCGFKSVKHRAGMPSTVASLFLVSMLAIPVIVGAGALGVRDRVVTAVHGVVKSPPVVTVPERTPTSGPTPTLAPSPAAGYTPSRCEALRVASNALGATQAQISDYLDHCLAG